VAPCERKAASEACGLAGVGNWVNAVYPVTNELHSRVRFLMDAQEQINAFIDIERRGWEIRDLLFPPLRVRPPSPTDLAEFAYPGCLYLIWAYQSGLWPPWSCKAYAIGINTDGSPNEQRNVKKWVVRVAILKSGTRRTAQLCL
jgi:hypothetical protein